MLSAYNGKTNTSNEVPNGNKQEVKKGISFVTKGKEAQISATVTGEVKAKIKAIAGLNNTSEAEVINKLLLFALENNDFGLDVNINNTEVN